MTGGLMRSLFAGAILLGAAGAGAANAATINYDLTLTPAFGKGPDGTGSFILDGTKVEDLSLTVDGLTFDDFKGVTGVFQHGTLVGLTGIDLDKGSSFTFNFFGHDDFGGLLAVFGGRGDDGKLTEFDIAMVDPAPLPPAWTMMLAGIVGLFVLWRRPKRTTALTAS